MVVKTSLTVLVGFLALVAATGAAAQTMNANSASFNAGYGRVSGDENQPIDVQLTDANSNLAVVNGQFQNMASSSVFASASAGGAGDSFSGAGGSASAIGNNLTVVTQGNYNTVIVSSVQNNSGAVTATTTSGKP